MTMTKLSAHVNFRITPEEKHIWLEYCNATARSQNDVFRAYLRILAKKLSKKGASSTLL